MKNEFFKELAIELCKFLGCILRRISLYGSSVTIKTEAINLLHETKMFYREQVQQFKLVKILILLFKEKYLVKSCYLIE